MTDEISGAPVTVSAVGGRARALFEGHEVADSEKALFLTERGQPPVCYFPREDVQISVMRRNDHATSNPWLGVATWYTIMRDAKVVEDVAWSYDQPFDDGAAITGFIAFAAEHVDFEFDTAAPVRHVPAHDPPYV